MTRLQTAYKHIIWDWNGTLLDDAWLCVEALNTILRRRGREPIGLDTYRQHFGFPVARFYEFLGFAGDDASFHAISREFLRAYGERWHACRLHEGAETALRRLSAAGATHSVLSAAQQEALESGVRHFGLEHHFQGLVGLDNIYAHGKLDQGRAWVRRLGCAASEILFVGDTLHDHEVAQAIGADCVLVPHGHYSADRLRGAAAPVLAGFEELLAHAGAASPRR